MNIIRILLISILLLIPLIHHPALFLGFELPKALAFKTLTLGTLFGFLFVVWQKKLPIKKVPKPVWIVIGALLLVNILATIFSGSMLESFWGSHARQQGLFTLIHYIVFGWLTFQAFEKKDLPWIFRSITILGIILGSWGILQKIAPGLFSVWQSDAFLGRVFATMGQPNFLGQLLLITIILGITHLFFKETNNWKIVGGISLILQFTTLFFTGNRASLLALLVIIFVFAIIAGLTFKKKILTYTGIGVIGISIVFVGSINLASQTTFVQDSPVLSRFDLTNPENIRSIVVRSNLYPAVLPLFYEHPILGHGQEMISFVFQRHASPELLELEQLDAIADRFHSEPLDILVTTGILGLLSWLALLGLLIVIAVRVIRDKDRTKEEKILSLGLIAAISGITLSNLVAFSTTTHFVYFWAIIGLLVLNSKKEHKKSDVSFLHNPTLTVVIFVLLVITFFQSINMLRADIAFRNSQMVPAAQAIPDLEFAVSNTPQSFYLSFLLRTYSVALPPEQSAAALKIAENAVKRNPEFSDFHYTKGMIELKMGMKNEGRESFEKATALAPYSPRVWKDWGRILYATNDFYGALQKFEKYIEISPDYWKWDDESVKGESEEFQNKYRIFFKLEPGFRTVFLFLGRAYFQDGNPEKALEVLEYADRDVDYYTTLGVIYGQQKQLQEAKEAFEAALELDPENAMIQQNLKLLKEEIQN